MRLRFTEALGAVIVLAVTIAACAIAIVSLCGCTAVEPEFSELETGQGRFSAHGTNLDHWYVIVDHETGAQYLYRYEYGVTPLLDADGTPLLAQEAGE